MLKIYTNLLLVLLLILTACNKETISGQKTNQSTKFATIGHIYHIAKNPARLKKLIKILDSKNLDYIFVLGDSGAWQKEIFDIYASSKAKIFHAIGNHDYQGQANKIQSYLKQVGYLDKVVKDKNANFIILNSGAPASSVKQVLDSAIKEIGKSQKPTLIMTHHPIWDDRKLSNHAFFRNKSYKFEEILSSIKGKVDYIFAGGTDRPLFGLDPMDTNYIYWTVIRDDITCYYSGAGDSTDTATLMINELSSNKQLRTQALKIKL